jgi:hypothetical protein
MTGTGARPPALLLLGEDSPRGRELAARWAEPAFRPAITLITAVWGAGYLAEAARQAA